MKSLGTTLRAAAAGLVMTGIAACGGSSHNIEAQRFKISVLVSDGAVPAPHTDPNLKNGWGLAFNPTAFAWVADNGTQKATLYDGNGVPQSLVVSIPGGSNGDSDPTGIVFNGSTDFVVTQGSTSGPAAFIFAGEGGTITAWAPKVALTNAFVVHDDGAGGAVYKGLAMASNGGANFLYATDFHNAKIDVFDKNFAKVAMSGGFVDPQMPPGFAPFGIQAIGAKLFVTYAKQDDAKHDDVKGAGLGMIDVFDTSGHLMQRFASGGALNAPWGVALAPGNFSLFSNAIIVGNFGDGMLNAFDPITGMSLGQLTQKNGNPIVQPGLWGIAFGNGVDSQPTNTLFFAAGPNGEADGAYGRIDVDM
jgi:uncharacterized protein (TIGR03118 family)